MHVQVADVWFLRVNLQTLSEPERLRAAQERIGDEDEPWTRKSAESSSSSSSCTQSTKLGPVHGPSSDEAGNKDIKQLVCSAAGHSRVNAEHRLHPASRRWMKTMLTLRSQWTANQNCPLQSRPFY